MSAATIIQNLPAAKYGLYYCGESIQSCIVQMYAVSVIRIIWMRSIHIIDIAISNFYAMCVKQKKTVAPAVIYFTIGNFNVKTGTLECSYGCKTPCILQFVTVKYPVAPLKFSALPSDQQSR